MEANKDLTALRSQLPHGAIKIISDRSGISYYSVLRVLNGDTRSPQLPEVIKAAADYLKEYKAKQQEANKAMNEAVNPETAEQLTARLNRQCEKYGEGVSPLY